MDGKELKRGNEFFELDFGYQFIFSMNESDITESIYNTDIYSNVSKRYAYSMDNVSFSDWYSNFTSMILGIDNYSQQKIYIRARYDLVSIAASKSPKIGLISIDCENIFDAKFTPNYSCPKIADKQKLICYSIAACETPMKIDTSEMESAMGNMQNMLNDSLVAGYNSMEVKYYKTSPDTKTTDHIMNEYGLLNVVAIGTISIVLEGNKIDTQSLEISPFGINFSSLTTFISKGHFASVFGVNSRPQNGDILVFDDYYNRILEVASADIEPGVGDVPNSYNVSLVKYSRNKNVIADPETQGLLDAMIPSDIDIEDIVSNIDDFKSSNIKNYDETGGEGNQREDIDDDVVIDSYKSYDLSESSQRLAVSYVWQPGDSDDVTINVSFIPKPPDNGNKEFTVVDSGDNSITLDTDAGYYGIEAGSFIFNDDIVVYVKEVDGDVVYVGDSSLVETGDTLKSLPNNDVMVCGNVLLSCMCESDTYTNKMFVLDIDDGSIIYSFDIGNPKSNGSYSSSMSINRKYKYVDVSSHDSTVTRFSLTDTFPSTGKISLLKSELNVTGVHVYNKSISQTDHVSLNRSAKNSGISKKVIDDRVNAYFNTVKGGIR